MFCSPCEPLSSGIWGNISAMESLDSGFLPHGFCPFQNYFYLLPKSFCSPKTWYLHHCVFRYRHNLKWWCIWTHQIFSEMDLILSPSSSHSREVLGYLLMERNISSDLLEWTLRKRFLFLTPCSYALQGESGIVGSKEKFQFFSSLMQTPLPIIYESLFGETGKSHSSLP